MPRVADHSRGCLIVGDMKLMSYPVLLLPEKDVHELLRRIGV